MKFFKGVIEDLFGHKKANKFRLKADMSRGDSSQNLRKQLGEETHRVVRGRPLNSFRER